MDVDKNFFPILPYGFYFISSIVLLFFATVHMDNFSIQVQEYNRYARVDKQHRLVGFKYSVTHIRKPFRKICIQGFERNSGKVTMVKVKDATPLKVYLTATDV